MKNKHWNTQEEYEATYGTQAEQANKQASIGVSKVDGPWRLVRWFKADGMGTSSHLSLVTTKVLPNSVRSTRTEVERLQIEEYTRTGILWHIVKFTRQQDRVQVS